MGTQDSSQHVDRADFPVVGVGASAGGLEALREMLGGYRGAPGMAFVIVQHLDPNHESLMAQLIDRYTTMPVRQIEGGETIEVDNVYVIPPGHGLSVENGVLRLTEFTDPRGMRRPIDDFFEALSEDLGPRSACVILSGTGADGSRGLRAIKEHHGITIAQQPEDARYDGMPLSAVGTGLVDYVRSSSEIINCLREFFDRVEGGPDTDTASYVSDHIEDLCTALRDQIGHDFTGYKRNTLARRIERRMQVLGIHDLSIYLTRIRNDPQECQALFRDLLINVTRFFRDTDAFASLRENVIRPMVREADSHTDLRVWIPGCSSGEEAYTIAILLAEEMRDQNRHVPVQVIASDIDDQMLRIAREGIYPIAALADIPEPMRSRYTVGHGDTFAICAPVREMVRFTLHSVIKDPPFGRIDLISCRNLLIYFDDQLQRSVLPLFHYALRPEGWLFLGPSETIGQHDDLFTPIDRKNRIFRRDSSFTSYPLELPSMINRQPHRSERPGRRVRDAGGKESDALRKLTATYSPASLLVDREASIISTWGPVGRYFDFSADRDRRLHATTLAKPGLREVLGVLVRQAAEDGQRHVAREVSVQTDFGTQQVQIVADPVRDGTVLVVVRETGPFRPQDEGDMVELAQSDDQVHLLEDELRLTRHRLRSTVEELETANEELKSSNEEMMSMNEELQSTNEELTTVNDELKNKIDQVLVAKSDLENFFDSTQLAVIVLDSGMMIRSFTDAACDLFPFQPGDRGRRLADVTTLLDSTEYLELARMVARTGEQAEARARVPSLDRDYALRVLPYRRPDNSIDGATLVFTDITAPLALERQLTEQRERLELAIRVARIGVWEYDPATGMTRLDDVERELLDVGADASGDMEAILQRVHPEDRDAVNSSLRRAMDGTEDYDQTFRIVTRQGRDRWLHGLARRVRVGNENRFIGVTYDISKERAALAERDLMLREMNHRIKNLFAVIGAMVSISEREAGDVAGFAEDLKRRIAAMGRAHALTQRRKVDEPVSIRELLEVVLTPARGEQDIAITGEEVLIPVSRLTPLALIFHEWATNATKYGVLASEGGRLSIDISAQGDTVVVDWRESTPERSKIVESKGFGTRLVEASVRQLDAKLDGSETETEFRRRLALRDLTVAEPAE
ncbi:CheR family methyltransferase [Croceicoccus sp. BE223]|uniref:CheR family methyltransferase n=1 Tax=Croceicoccus sp. BE223 TaxID=2817716 RepID=UPI00285D8A64|nr:CheR family methyltransferase [Croceicoccus sp. BE223]MDR7103042.1 two-component system CheB/CheR fusion protein [Croceicoccus sp. BE223]